MASDEAPTREEALKDLIVTISQKMSSENVSELKFLVEFRPSDTRIAIDLLSEMREVGIYSHYSCAPLERLLRKIKRLDLSELVKDYLSRYPDIDTPPFDEPTAPIEQRPRPYHHGSATQLPAVHQYTTEKESHSCSGSTSDLQWSSSARPRTMSHGPSEHSLDSFGSMSSLVDAARMMAASAALMFAEASRTESECRSIRSGSSSRCSSRCSSRASSRSGSIRRNLRSDASSASSLSEQHLFHPHSYPKHSQSFSGSPSVLHRLPVHKVPSAPISRCRNNSSETTVSDSTIEDQEYSDDGAQAVGAILRKILVTGDQRQSTISGGTTLRQSMVSEFSRHSIASGSTITRHSFAPFEDTELPELSESPSGKKLADVICCFILRMTLGI